MTLYEDTPYDPEVPPLEETTISGVPWELYQDPPAETLEVPAEGDYDEASQPDEGDAEAIVERQSLGWLDRMKGK